jgi:hypothetical protein
MVLKKLVVRIYHNMVGAKKNIIYIELGKEVQKELKL